MKFYGKKFLRNRIDRQISSRKETQDALVWDVLPEDKIALVRIQGSSTNIIARYPENWEETPVWLKRGNAVKINFTGGSRGRVELVGHGYLIPTPIDSTAIQPDPQVADDAVLTGMLVYPIPLNQRMAVMVKTGTYQIAGITYTLGPITMDDYDPWYMEDGGKMGEVAAIIDIDPPSGYYRYDWIVVGVDGVVDYVKGPNFTDTPVSPTLPSGHIFLNQIFVYPGMTSVGYSDIGKTYAEPIAAGLSISVSDPELDWTETSSTISVQVIDQYGAVFNLTGGIFCTMRMISGNGTISGSEGSTSALDTPIGSYVYSGTYATFTYTRNGDAGDESPTFQIDMQGESSAVSSMTYITLLDESGDQM